MGTRCPRGSRRLTRLLAAAGGWLVAAAVTAAPVPAAPSAPVRPGDPAGWANSTTTAGQVWARPRQPAPKPAPVVVRRPALRRALARGSTGPLVVLLNQRLRWLGYPVTATSARYDATTAAAVAGFQVKFFLTATAVVDTGTWRTLWAMAGTPGVLPRACLGQNTLCVDKTAKLLRWVVAGVPRVTLDARFGMPGRATAEGTFRVTWKSRDHTSSLYHTWMPFAMFFYRGQAIHYSPYFARDGYWGGSHGCINIRNYAAIKALFNVVPVGTRVYVYRS